MELSLSDEIMREGIALFRPDLIVCPFLKDRIPDDIWKNHSCLIVHPGIEGDRGPSSMDWAMMEDAEEWGVTVLQAAEVMDAGDIWAASTFRRRPTNKARMYRHEITEAGVRAIMDAIRRFSSSIYFPRKLDYTDPSVKGKLRLPLMQEDRKIDWLRDDMSTIVKKIHSGDNQPGVLDTLFGKDTSMVPTGKANCWAIPASSSPGARTPSASPPSMARYGYPTCGKRVRRGRNISNCPPPEYWARP